MIASHKYTTKINKSNLDEKFIIISNGKKPTNENIIKFSLSPKIAEQFGKFCSGVDESPYVNPEYSYKIMENKLRSIFPTKLIQALEKMSRTGKPGMLLIDGFPVDNNLPTRLDYEDPLDRSNAKPTKVSEFAMLAVTSIMGKHLQSNPKEQNGAIIHQISPIRTKYLTASSQGVEPLIYHVENAVEKQTPDFLILACLEGDPQAATAYFFVGDFIKDLPENIIKSMKKDNFTIRSGASYDEVEINRLPLLSEDNDTRKLQVRLHEILCDRFQPLTEEALDTINFLKEKLGNVRNNDSYITGNVSLKKGQVLILNNAWGIGQVDGIMHARDGRITNDGRWLQRGFMYPNTEENNNKIIEGHTQALSDTLLSKDIPISESSSQLREVMLSTDSALEYSKNNPNATRAQIALYGIKPQRLSKMIEQAHKNRLLDRVLTLNSVDSFC